MGMTEPALQPVPNPAPDSLMAFLSGRIQRQAMERRRTFPIPGTDGCLGLKLRSADANGMFRDESAGIMDADGLTDEEIAEVMQARRGLIARATVEVMYRDIGHDADDPWKPFSDRLGSAKPTRLDELAEWFGWEDVKSSTDVVKRLIPYDFNLAGFYTMMVVWFAQEDPTEQDELVGESSAAP